MAWWFTVILWAGAFALNKWVLPKDEEEEEAKGNDLDEPTAKEDRPIPILFGRYRIRSPNCVYLDTPLQDPITQRVRTSIFSSTSELVGYRYAVNIMLGWCQGVVEDVTRLWWGDDVFYDSTAASNPDPVINSAAPTMTKEDLNFFNGAPVSPGDRSLTTSDGFSLVWEWKFGESVQSAANYFDVSGKLDVSGQTPTFPLLAYSVNLSSGTSIIGDYVGNSGRMPEISAEMSRFPNTLGLTGDLHKVNTDDANPAAVIYEILTDTDWGRAVPASDIETSTFTAAAQTLSNEGNGYATLHDRRIDTLNLIRAIEQQIDGIVHRNTLTNKFELKLIRSDYDIDTVPEINDENILDIESFTRGTWEGTSNNVTVRFEDRGDDYKETTAPPAQDMANEFILGTVVPVEKNYKGVKNKSLANRLAWRDLRTLSRPLAQGSVVTDRTMSQVQVGDVLAFSVPERNITKMAVRVSEVDVGSVLEGRVRISFNEDIWFDQAPSFDDQDGTVWTPPADELQVIPALEHIVLEAPRGMMIRHEFTTDPSASKLFACARRQTFESFFFAALARSTDGVTEGTYELNSQISSADFIEIGQLTEAITPGSSYTAGSLPSIQLDAAESAASVLSASFEVIASEEELGVDLRQLIYVDGTNGGEFMLVSASGAGGTGDLTLLDVFRGVLDTVQGSHAIGDRVYLIFLGTAISFVEVPPNEFAHVRLRPTAYFEAIAFDAAGIVEKIVDMDKRAKRPLPPSSYTADGVFYGASLSFGDPLSESSDIDFVINRRDFDQLNEVAALRSDAGVLNSGYPTANTTTHDVFITNAAGTTTYTQTQFGSGTTASVLQVDFLIALNDTAYPSAGQVQIEASHTIDGETLTSTQRTKQDVLFSSILIGLHVGGARANTVATNAYAATAGDATNGLDLEISSSFAAGTAGVEYQINGGGWLSGIALGATTGSIPSGSITAADTIEFRTNSTDTSYKKVLVVSETGGSEVAYAAFFG